MIVNHKYKFIFLKTSKTAGSSTEAFLRRFCQEGDVVTPLDINEEQEIRSLGLCPATGYKKIRGKASIIDRIRIAYGHKRTLQRCCIFAHSSASEVKEYVGDEVWNSYYKFCTLRNPIDRVLSQYFWKASTRNWKDAETNFTARFDAFLKSKQFSVLIRKGRDLITIDNEPAVDFILDYHDLENSISHVLNHLGIDRDEVVLPRFKSVQRPAGDFHNRINEQQRELIMRTFELEDRLLRERQRACLERVSQ